MRILVLGGFVAGLAALSGTAMADQSTGTAAPAAQTAPAAQGTSVAQAAPAATPAATADADLDRVVCRSETAPTGTRLGTRHSCHTQREWARMQQEQQNHLTELQIQKSMPPAH